MGKLLPAVVVSSAMVAMLATIIWTNPVWTAAKPREIPIGANTTSLIGALLMGDFSLLFIASAVAILVALVGAAMIARSDRLSPEEAAERM